MVVLLAVAGGARVGVQAGPAPHGCAVRPWGRRASGATRSKPERAPGPRLALAFSLSLACSATAARSPRCRASLLCSTPRTTQLPPSAALGRARLLSAVRPLAASRADMSSRPPPDAAPEGSYWVAELSGIPSSISIDQVRRLDSLSRPPTSSLNADGSLVAARSSRGRPTPGGSTTVLSGSRGRRPVSAPCTSSLSPSSCRLTARRSLASPRSGLGFKTWDELLIAIHGLNGIEVKKWNSVVGTSVRRAFLAVPLSLAPTDARPRAQFAFNDIHYFSAEGESLLTHKDPGNRIWYMRSSTFKGPSLPVGATSGVPGQPQLQNPASRFFRAASQAPTLHAQPHPPPPPQQQQMLPPAPPSRPLANDYGAAYPTYRPSPSAQQSNFSDSPPSPKRVRSNSHGSGAFGDAEFGPVKEEGDDGAAAGLLLQDRRSSIDVSSQGYMPANKHDGRGGGEHGGGGGGGVRGGGDRHLFVEGVRLALSRLVPLQHHELTSLALRAAPVRLDLAAGQGLVPLGRRRHPRRHRQVARGRLDGPGVDHVRHANRCSPGSRCVTRPPRSWRPARSQGLTRTFFLLLQTGSTATSSTATRSRSTTTASSRSSAPGTVARAARAQDRAGAGRRARRRGRRA